MDISQDMLRELIAASRRAGEAALEVYDTDFDVSYKDDRSPVTEADRRSHGIIKQALAEVAPDTPLLSEEGRDVAYAERRSWREFFLVDPLDGTKEFIKRNGDFTVNIALIRDGAPTMGIIFVPVTGVMYYALRGHGAFSQTGEGEPDSIAVNQGPSAGGLVVASSRSHGSTELDKYLENFKVKERVSRGSSLKFCLVAEGRADLYPRLGPTWEWDTAAGHAIVEEAGGKVLDLGGKPLLYNKEVLKHAGFVALAMGI
jgi:3'(2'), 5'-bisphosphate nucleotidase